MNKSTNFSGQPIIKQLLKLLPSEINSRTADIYKHRWQIETLFKRLKQNFPLKYFLGDNQNAIEIQVWCELIIRLLMLVRQRKTKRRSAYSNMVSMVRFHLMTYIDLFKFLEDPNKKTA